MGIEPTRTALAGQKTSSLVRWRMPKVAWLAQDLLKGSTGDGLKFFNDEYLDIMNHYPGEFAPQWP
jgi:hypothetical protein